jgi:PKD repeat protein
VTDVGQTINQVEWDFDGDGTYELTGASVQHIYPSAGPKTIWMRVTDSAAAQVAERQPAITVATRQPNAQFEFNPFSPLPGESVLFASSSSDPDGEPLGHAWDFGDGVTSSLRNPTHPFATPGTKTVTLTVTDPFGASHTTTRQVVVQGLPVAANDPPVASFAFSPRIPQVGQQVEFVSSAVDPEGNLREQRWDLDGDGQFDDAQGDRVLETYTTPGDKTVRLRVEDAGDGAAVRERTVSVAPGPVARAGFLNPFPVVRITGEVRGSGARVRVLSVRAPRRTLVRVRCSGEGCPRIKVRRKRVGRSRLVRFKAFERLLPAGVRLEVFVRQGDKIGKYTSFRIRRGAAPKRTDRCLMPDQSRPVRCP